MPYEWSTPEYPMQYWYKCPECYQKWFEPVYKGEKRECPHCGNQHATYKGAIRT